MGMTGALLGLATEAPVTATEIVVAAFLGLANERVNRDRPLNDKPAPLRSWCRCACRRLVASVAIEDRLMLSGVNLARPRRGRTGCCHWVWYLVVPLSLRHRVKIECTNGGFE